MPRPSALALLLPLLAASGCATAGPAVPASSLAACTVAGAPDGWREVATPEVRFCVPATWSSRGARTWAGGGGEVTWSTTPRRREVGSATVMIRGSEPPTEQQVREALRIREVYRGTEQIDGATVELAINSAQGDYFSGATWRSGGEFYMYGDASNESAARDHLMIYRTARRGG